MSEAVLQLQDVETYYGQIHALRGIGFEVREGQVVALLGANGAGKSTSLRTISGLVPARRGKVTFAGQDITRMPAHRIAQLGLVHVPEGRRIFKGMTIEENLDLGGFCVLSADERRRRREAAYAMFPILAERRHRDSSLLSGGEQQMLAIARALMAKPRLLLLDEPSMGLAPILVQEIMRTIRRLNEAGTTVLLVEQNARAALRLAHYGCVMETGRIVLKGDAASLAANEALTKAYLGA
ncbi:MAG: ABC transporter ATP-binding protein [Rhodospirillales bacterium]|jgi:branched-chain amino acid transport system ATP-binding protein|nr:ABC transporter ATP-binding protein [Rhodospirillales bacterium]